MNIRLLKPNEIECRVQSVKKTKNSIGCILLLYKDARCDMKILDEVFTPLGWEREHQLINGNLFCTVKVWDEKKEIWISKQDVGTESNTEKEKGQASDSFKRACFNLGIGRELYTAPFIWIDLKEGEHTEYNGKYQVSSFVKFEVKSIGYNEEREINALEIADNKGNVRYSLKSNKAVVEIPITTKSTKQPKVAPTNDLKPQCSSCKKEITVAEHDFSVGKYKKPLCRACQKAVS
jgi:hypothetical protein